MNLIRLTYFLAPSDALEEDKFQYSNEAYEILGSPDAIWNTWFQFQQMEESKPASAHPRFVKVYPLYGLDNIDMTRGIGYVKARANSLFS
jgi:hypothetical protein